MTTMTLLTRVARHASVAALLGAAACNLDTGDVSEPKTLFGASSSSQAVKTNAPATISVFVLNQYGEPIQGAQVTFTLESGTGNLVPTNVASSVQGLAETTFTPTRAGSAIVAVRAGSLAPIRFTITATD